MVYSKARLKAMTMKELLVLEKFEQVMYQTGLDGVGSG